jgi:hypothetical protein
MHIGEDAAMHFIRHVAHDAAILAAAAGAAVVALAFAKGAADAAVYLGSLAMG